jgi:hypothetical protein
MKRTKTPAVMVKDLLIETVIIAGMTTNLLLTEEETIIAKVSKAVRITIIAKIALNQMVVVLHVLSIVGGEIVRIALLIVKVVPLLRVLIIAKGEIVLHVLIIVKKEIVLLIVQELIGLKANVLALIGMIAHSALLIEKISLGGAIMAKNVSLGRVTARIRDMVIRHLKEVRMMVVLVVQDLIRTIIDLKVFHVRCAAVLMIMTRTPNIVKRNR